MFKVAAPAGNLHVNDVRDQLVCCNTDKIDFNIRFTILIQRRTYSGFFVEQTLVQYSLKYT